jgi:acyl carrier protein
MTTNTPEWIYRDLGKVMSATFPDRDISVTVEAGTRVFGDLGLASIDLIVLGERLEQFYGRRLPFGPFLADLRNRGTDDMELGELVNFLLKHIA